MSRPVILLQRKIDQDGMYVDQNGKYLTSEVGKGIFHSWGLKKGESTAIIEIPDGTVINQLVEEFRFDDKNNDKEKDHKASPATVETPKVDRVLVQSRALAGKGSNIDLRNWTGGPL